MATVTWKVEGMSCEHCVKAVETAVKEAGASGSVDLENKKVTITYDEGRVSLDQVKDAIEDQGYDVTGEA